MFDNQHGHFGKKLGFVRALNMSKANCFIKNRMVNRVKGTNYKGLDTCMYNVNVHRGFSNNSGPDSRGSGGCPTIDPDDADRFFNNFDFNQDNPLVGSSYGRIYIFREDEQFKDSIVNLLNFSYGSI